VDKLTLHSPDLTERNIDKLAELFPAVVTEALDEDGYPTRAIDFDLLREELSPYVVDGPQERYQLDWPGKREALFVANAPIAKTLRPARDESVDFDSTRNVFIEGDNLDALKLLQESYLGKIKLIYIDPPYNTGNDFVYSDNFAETTSEFLERSRQIGSDGSRLVANPDSNGRFHSDWLSMIYPRLRLARNLMADDGVIFISIDDGEVANLRKVADQVFGESNFVANVVWQKKYTRANDARWFSDNHDHLLCYARNKAGTVLNLLPRDASQLAAYLNPDGHPKGPWKATPLHAKSGTNNASYVFNNGVVWSPPVGTYRRFNDDAMRRMEEGGEIWFGSDGNQTPSRKSFLSEVKDGVTPVTIWTYDEVGHNHEANSELKALDMGGLFSNPKPTRLIRRMLALATGPGDVVLDFFAGSGTTAEAVLAANAEDGGERRFILVQLPEEVPANSVAAQQGFANLAEMSIERVRRAAAKIRAGAGDTETVVDVGYRVLKVDSTNIADVLRAPDATTQSELALYTNSVKADRTSEDLLFQVLLDWGLDLTVPITIEVVDGQEIHVVEGDALIACFADKVSDKVVKAIAERQPLRAVFRDSGFAKDADRINAEQIFAERSPATDVKTI
jgi:adenine-specific DNA-methyltransferase